jgi:uncharacterized protein (DUF58 family)
VRVPAWLGPRAYVFLSAIALLFAAAAAFAPLWWLALAAAAALTIALAADSAQAFTAAVEVSRIEPDPFALRHAGTLAYRITNRGAGAVRVGIVEAPIALLRYNVDELCEVVPAKSCLDVHRPVTPVSRGSARLSGISYWLETPLGLVRRRAHVTAAAAVRVYPDLSAVERYGSLHARNRLIEAGLRRMRLRGTGTVAESVREFEPGDSFRDVNWKATARRGKMMVSQYEVERSQNVVVLLDAGRLMTPLVGEQRKFDYALTAALSVAGVAALANDKIGAVAFAGTILRAYPPRTGGRGGSALSSALYDLEPRFEESDYDAAFSYVRAHLHKRSLLLLFTDMIDPSAQSAVLQQISTLARRHLVVCAFMNDAAIERTLERDPDTPARVYATGVALELQEERRSAAAVLHRLGVQVVDVPARELTTALIDRYLRIKQRGQL